MKHIQATSVLCMLFSMSAKVLAEDGGTAGNPINGVCGSASGGSFPMLSSNSPNLCAIGVVIAFASDGDSASWGCDGINGGAATARDACTATIVPPACDVQHYWLCSDGPCQNQGLFYWDAACRTIPEPQDWVGSDLISNGGFDAWSDGFPEEWTHFGNNVEQTGTAVRLFDGTALRQPVLEGGKSYRYAVNVHAVHSGQLEVFYYDQSDYFTAAKTITGTFSLDAVVPDWSIYFIAQEGSNDVIIDSIVVRELDIQTCVETPAACLSEETCTTAGWNWLDGVCYDGSGGDDVIIRDAGLEDVRQFEDVHIADSFFDRAQTQDDAVASDAATAHDIGDGRGTGDCNCRSVHATSSACWVALLMLLAWAWWRYRSA